MLLSLAIIFLVGMLLGVVFKRFGLPSLIGMLLTGVILGPYLLNLIDGSLLAISTELRQMALIIILLRAGLNLDVDDLKKVGRPALLLSFVPAVFEIAGTVLLAPVIFGISRLDAAVLGTVIAAVSPAVIVPSMLVLMKSGYGTQKRIPQMILAGASVDDIFVIVLFTVFSGLSQTGSVSAGQLLVIPTSILFGIAGGILAGMILTKFFTSFHLRDSSKVLVMLSVAFLLVSLEKQFQGMVGFSGLLAVMAMGITLKYQQVTLASRLSNKFSKLWVAAELLLFVLVGASVNIQYALKAGLAAVILIMGALIFRLAGVFVSLIKTSLNPKERLFSAFAYIPKATVQAAIGGLPLAMGLSSGELILTVAVVAIMVTAPLGATLIEKSYKKLLQVKK